MKEKYKFRKFQERPENLKEDIQIRIEKIEQEFLNIKNELAKFIEEINYPTDISEEAEKKRRKRAEEYHKFLNRTKKEIKDLEGLVVFIEDSTTKNTIINRITNLENEVDYFFQPLIRYFARKTS